MSHVFNPFCYSYEYTSIPLLLFCSFWDPDSPGCIPLHSRSLHPCRSEVVSICGLFRFWNTSDGTVGHHSLADPSRRILLVIGIYRLWWLVGGYGRSRGQFVGKPLLRAGLQLRKGYLMVVGEVDSTPSAIVVGGEINFGLGLHHFLPGTFSFLLTGDKLGGTVVDLSSKLVLHAHVLLGQRLTSLFVHMGRRWRHKGVEFLVGQLAFRNDQCPIHHIGQTGTNDTEGSTSSLKILSGSGSVGRSSPVTGQELFDTISIVLLLLLHPTLLGHGNLEGVIIVDLGKIGSTLGDKVGKVLLQACTMIKELVGNSKGCKYSEW